MLLCFSSKRALARVQISLVYDTAAGAGAVTELKVKYFDTIPVCTALCILKTGFLFAASEAGDHGFYEFLGLGDDDDGVEASSLSTKRTADGFAPIFFDPQLLKNLQLVDSMMSLAPMTDMKVKNLIGAVRPCFSLHPDVQFPPGCAREPCAVCILDSHALFASWIQALKIILLDVGTRSRLTGRRQRHPCQSMQRNALTLGSDASAQNT